MPFGFSSISSLMLIVLPPEASILDFAPSLKLNAATVWLPLRLPLPRTLPGTRMVSFLPECLEMWLRLGSAQFLRRDSSLPAMSRHRAVPDDLLCYFRSPIRETIA